MDHISSKGIVAWDENWFRATGTSPISAIPADRFIPSTDLQQFGWPDFTAKSLADWKSSVVPAPPEPSEDCCLVLSFPRTFQPLSSWEDWVLAWHETGGIWEESKRIVVKRLSTSSRGITILHGIGRAMAHSNVSADFALFDQLTEYRRMLNDLGLDCNQHIQCLAEGFYPVDLTEEALSIFEVISVPREVLELTGHEIMCLAVLAPNCSDW